MAKTKELQRYRFTFNGKQYAVYGHSQAELYRKADAKKKELERQDRISKSMTVQAWKEEWLEVYKRPAVSEATYKNYKSLLERLDLDMPLAAVRPIDLQGVVNDMQGMSEWSIKKFCTILRSLFADAAENGLIETNPAKKLTHPRGYKRPRRPLTARERDLIEQVAPSSIAGPFVALMLYAGLRPGEASIVQGRDIQANIGVLHVRGTKTDAADRYVPISDKLMPYIEGLGQDEYAVKSVNGEPTNADSRRHLWNIFLRELNVAAGSPVGRPNKHTPWDVPLENRMADDLVPYLLRHTFCTDLEAAGVPLNVARDLMGHSSVEITSRIYTHRSEEALQDAAEKMNSFAKR
jgi:integrase